MAIKIFYQIGKEGEGEDEVIEYKSISDLFLPKIVPGEEVDKEKEVHIHDLKRDLSNFFELSAHLRPSSLFIDKESTGIYVEANDENKFQQQVAVKTVEMDRLWTSTVYSPEGGWEASIPEELEFEIPSHLRSRWLFCSVEAWHNGYADSNLLCAGSFVPPGTSKHNAQNPLFPSVGDLANRNRMLIHLHPVTLDPSIALPPEGFVDLASVYTGKGDKERKLEWWQFLLFIDYHIDRVSPGKVNVVPNLPKESFKWRATQSVYWQHKNDYINTKDGTKIAGDVSVSYSVGGGNSTAGVFGIPRPW